MKKLMYCLVCFKIINVSFSVTIDELINEKIVGNYLFFPVSLCEV
jgi:hypothetical protein